jgi:hypothetical protein
MSEREKVRKRERERERGAAVECPVKNDNLISFFLFLNYNLILMIIL